LGVIDVLVNNASGVGTTATLASSSSMTPCEKVAVNLTATFKLCKALIPGILEAGDGSVVNITALAGTKPRARFGAIRRQRPQ
jgi:short-subunit dehydrogenase